MPQHSRSLRVHYGRTQLAPRSLPVYFSVLSGTCFTKPLSLAKRLTITCGGEILLFPPAPPLQWHCSTTKMSASIPVARTLTLALILMDKRTQEPLPKVDKSRLWALSRPERQYLVVALVAVTFSGCVFPVFSLLLSTIISFFYLTDADELQRKVRLLQNTQ